jgi:hypothetical protein
MRITVEKKAVETLFVNHLVDVILDSDEVDIQVDALTFQVDEMALQVVQNPNINKLILNSIC